jgi:outer membrane protein assembly factor BamB
MERKSQRTPWQVWLPFALFHHPLRNGKAQRGGLAFVNRILLSIIILLSTLPVSSSLDTSPSPVQAQSTNFTYLPYVSRITSPVLHGSGEWPMAGANPERTSWTSTEVKGSLKAEWYTHFDAYISQKVQIIAAADKLFISAADGLHALDSNDGREMWFFRTSLPPGNAPTYDNGVVYLGSFNRNMYAIDATYGRELWSYTAGSGFETNPLVVDGLVMAGNRDGYFYAIYASGSQAGQLAWRYKTNGQILYSAAYKDGVVYFASQDMYAYALNVSDGSLEWKSAKLPGAGFHSWWPVIYDNYVVFSGNWTYRLAAPFGNATHTVIDREAYPSGAATGSTIGATGTVKGDWASGTRTMNASRISQYFESKPQRRTTIVLSRSNGREYTYDSDGDNRAEYAPFLYVGTNSATRYPPAVGADGVLYQANNYIYDPSIPRGHITGWKFGTTTISIPTTVTSAVDEPIGYAIGGNTVYWKLCCDRKAGSFNLSTHSDATYFDQGGIRLRRTLPDLFSKGWDFAYWKHGDTTPPIPYNGRVYTINNNAVVAFSSFGKDPVLPADESTGSATGTAPSNLEGANVITGLNTKVTLNATSWPLLYQQERYYEFREESTTRAAHFPIFEVAAATSGNPTSVRVTTNNVAASIVSTFSGGTLTTRVSNRAPAILFQNTSNTYQLRGSLAGIAYPTSSGVQVRTSSATVNGSTLSESWLLVWDATTRHRWMPMVISLQERPSQISFTTTGLTISYSSAAGSLGVTPLYGMSAPKSSEESSWRTSIPSATVGRVRTMNNLARAFPSSGSETLAINASGDAEFTYTYQYIITTDDWSTSYTQLAYLPTHLALAAWNGSPIRINGTTFENITDVGFLTPIGRVAGVPNTNTVQVTLPGIANTWRNIPDAPGTPASGDDLQEKLIDEVEKILDAGHLLPGYGMHGLWDSKASSRIGHYLSDYWHNPAETIYTLIRALPLLPADMRTRVRSYLTSEFTAYPTYSTTHVGWVSGAARDALTFPPEVQADRPNFDPCGECNPWGITGENHYASWMYAANFGGASTIYNNTASKISASPAFPQSFSYALNSQVDGYIGYLRLAALANAGSKPDAEKTLVNMLVLRAALSKYPSALDETHFEYGGYKWAMRTYAPNMPDTLFVLRTMGTLWSQTPLYGYPKDVLYGLSGPGTGGAYVFGIDYVNLTPELGAFMRSYTLNEERDAIADYEQRAPHWFVALAEEAAGEGALRPIHDTIALYQAKAYILQASRSELEQYLDAPAVAVGDLYYIQKLILALEAGN